MNRSELVDEVIESRDTSAETLSGSDLLDEDLGFASDLEGIGGEHLPMVEDALREGTTGGGGTKSLGESEGLSDGQVGLDVDERGSGDGLLSSNNTSPLGQALIDSSYGIIRALDLNQEDGLHETGLSSQYGGVEDTSSSRNDLTTTSVDSIGVESHILDIEADTAHVLIGHHTLLGGPLEGSFHRVLDFIEILDLFGNINEQVGAGGLWAETPDLLCIVGVPLIVVLEHASTLFHFLLGGNLLFLDGVSEVISERSGSAEDSVVLVGRLRETNL